MNKKTILTLTLLALSTTALQAVGHLEDIAMVNQPITISKEWLNAKKLLAEQPQEGENVIIAFDMNNIALSFDNTVKVYLGNSNPKVGQELATELLRYFKLAYKVAEANAGNAIILKAKEDIEKTTLNKGALLLAKAKAFQNNDLATALKQFGIKD